MTDITVLIMTQTSSHTLPPEKEGGRWRALEPVDVWPFLRMPGPNLHPRQAHVHIMGISETFPKIKAFFLQEHLDKGDDLIMHARRTFLFSDIPAQDQQ